MQKKNAAIYYFIYSSTMAAFNSFFVLYMENDLGFTESQAGNIISLNFIIGLFLGPTSAFIHDKINKRHIIAPLFYMCTGILMLLLGMAPSDIAIVTILAVAVYSSRLFGPGLVDKIVFELQEEGKLTYSGVRGFAGFGYSLSVLLLSFVISDAYRPAFWFISLAYFIIAIQVFFMRTEHAPEPGKIRMKDIPHIFRNKRIIFITLSNALLFSTDSVNNFYRGVYVESFVSFDVSFGLGLLIFLCAAGELPMGQIARKVLKRLGYRKLFLLTYCVFFIQYIGYLLAGVFQSQILLYAVAPLHAVTMGLYYPTFMQWVRDSVPSKQFATTLAIPAAFVMLFGTVSSRAASIIRRSYPIHIVYVYFLGVLFVGILVQLVYFKFFEKETV